MRTITHAALALAMACAASLSSACVAPSDAGDAEDTAENENAVVGFAVGISDSDPETFTHPAWAGLDVHRARVVVPWDVGQRPANDPRRQKFEAWLGAAAAAGVEPYVTLGPSDLHKASAEKFLAPTGAEYEAAFVAFRQTWPALHLIGPWNEPNYPNTLLASGVALDDASCSKETLGACGPLLAAFYWRVARKHCADCVLVAGEFSAKPHDPYWGAYKKYLRDHRPKVWSIHPHHDANRFQAGGHHCVAGDESCTTRSFMGWLQDLGPSWDGSHVWLTEVGAYRRNADGEVFSEKSQRDATAFILRLPKISKRITRIYYYNFQNACSPSKCPVQDRGLVSPPTKVPYDGLDEIRSAYAVIRDRDTSP